MDYRIPYHWILHQLPITGVWPLDHQVYTTRAVKLTMASNPAVVLEVGCGDGYNCGLLARQGVRTVGFDLNSHAIRHAQALVPTGVFHQIDITQHPADELSMDDPYNAVLAVEVIEHIKPRKLPELVAKIGDLSTRFVLTTPSANIPATNPNHYKHYTQQEIDDLLTSAGFRIVSREGYGSIMAEKRFLRWRKVFDSRFLQLKPALRWLEKYYLKRATKSGMPDCRGYIFSAEKS